MTPKILFVDDDPNLLAGFQRNLRNTFRFDTALGGQAGLDLIRTNGPYALLVVDMRMPSMDGVEFLEHAAKLAPDAVGIMLTGNADQQTAIDAVNRGHVFRFLNKPCPPDKLAAALETGLKQFELQQMERELLEETLTGSVKILSEVLGMIAPDALGRGERLRACIHQFGRYIDAKRTWELEVAALLSCLGSASLPINLLRKLGSGCELTPAERVVADRVPQIGHDLLIGIPRLSGVARIVLFQRKRFDGSGPPPGDCSGEMIPLGARMLKILTDRLELEAEGVAKDEAFAAMKARVGSYDPRLLESCFECFESFLANAVSSEGSVRALGVHELTVGQIVVSDITTPSNLILMAAGNRLTEMTLRRLQNYLLLGEVKQPILVQDSTRQLAPAVRVA